VLPDNVVRTVLSIEMIQANASAKLVGLESFVTLALVSKTATTMASATMASAHALRAGPAMLAAFDFVLMNAVAMACVKTANAFVKKAGTVPTALSSFVLARTMDAMAMEIATPMASAVAILVGLATIANFVNVQTTAQAMANALMANASATRAGQVTCAT